MNGKKFNYILTFGANWTKITPKNIRLAPTNPLKFKTSDNIIHAKIAAKIASVLIIKAAGVGSTNLWPNICRVKPIHTEPREQ